MNRIPLETLNRTLESAGFSPVKILGNELYLSCLTLLWQGDNKEEKFKILLSEKLINEFELLEFFINNIETIECSYDKCPLVKILNGTERDGTLKLSDSEHIYNVCWDLYLDFIKNIVLLGGEIDHDALLEQVFSNGKQSFEIFNYLVENYDFKNSSIAKSISSLLYINVGNIDFSKRNNALHILESKGLDVNEVYDEESDYIEYELFLAFAFSFDPASFKRYLKLNPTQETIEQFPWRFIFNSVRMTDPHLQAINSIKQSGYDLPIDDIADFLEKKYSLEYANEIRGGRT